MATNHSGEMNKNSYTAEVRSVAAVTPMQLVPRVLISPPSNSSTCRTACPIIDRLIEKAARPINELTRFQIRQYADWG